MALEPGFIDSALAYLRAHPDVAGVGGLLRDTRINTAADKARAAHYGAIRHEAPVASLGGGGLYRRAAVDAVGYLAHRWLPACEEAELGVRLAAAGWRLVRLPLAAVRHSGHQESSAQMLARLWRGGRMQAYGMFLRSALGRPWLGRALRSCWFVFAAPALHVLALALAAAALLAGAGAWPACALAEAGVWLAAWLAQALWSLLAWQLYAAAAAAGFLRRPGDPREPIAARRVQGG
jgi:GT2 family glycosyltransferase